MKKIFNPTKRKEMNKNHIYYYQVQGQLHITEKKYCIFAVFTGVDIYWVTVERDDQFWEDKMHRKLTDFYEDCLLPEILDSRYLRRMELREPEYILNARKEKKKVDNNNKRKTGGLDPEEICELEDLQNLESILTLKRPRLAPNFDESSYGMTKS